MATKRKSKSVRCQRWGILNRFGDLWTSNQFETKIAAQDYVVAYWHNFPGPPRDTKQFKIVPVRVTITPIKE